MKLNNLGKILVTTTLILSCNTKKTPDDVEVVSGEQFADEHVHYKPGVNTGMGKYVTKSLYGTKKVVLTFDDGPHPRNTPVLLDLLKEKNVKATFFVMGALAKKYPKIIKRIKDEGHIVAMHAYSHDDSNKLTKAQFEDSIEKSIKSIRAAGWTDDKELYFRFPYGNYGSKRLDYHHYESLKDIGEKLYGENCLNFTFWDVDTSDWYLKKFKNGAKLIAETTMAYLEGGNAHDFWYLKKKKGPRKITNGFGGGVILLHDIHKTSVAATKIILKELDINGYEVVPLNQVEEFEYDDSKVCNQEAPRS